MAEHGFRNDVEADKMLGGRSPKPEATRPDNGIPVEIAPHGQCRFAVSITPAKLMAGQTGTVTIAMLLEGDSVMESPHDLRIVLPEAEANAQSQIRLGAAVVLPPRSSNLAAAYRGRQVYDNWATVELPITMSAEAPLGSMQAIEVEAHFRLHEGSTGRLFGEFRNPLTIACEVGSVPDPAIRPPSGHAGTTERVATGDRVPEGTGLPQAERSPAEPAGTETAGGPEVLGTPGRPAPLVDRVPEPSDGKELLTLLLGVGLLAAVALLLLVRGR